MITSLRLQNFRSYVDYALEFDGGVNIIIGQNGSGKTNLLEALLVACRGSSYRAKDIDLVHHEKDWARTDAYLGTNEHRVAKIQIKEDKSIKSFEIDDKLLRRLMLERTIPTVLFEPNQLQSLTTSPDQRRLFVDELLEQTDRTFTQDKRAYNRALAQRNRLLKHNQPNLSQHIFVWNVRLSELGEKIASKRAELISRFNKNLVGVYQSISLSTDKLSLAYTSKHNLNNYASELLAKLEQSLPKEILQGYTLYGPHRDDIAILLNKKPVQTTASRGEVRTILLSLKMEEVKLIEEQRDQKPLLLLDDVFGELDGVRRKALTDFLRDHQAFITTTDADVIQKNFTRSSNIVVIDQKRTN